METKPNIIQSAAAAPQTAMKQGAQQSISALVNAFLDGQGMRKRFDELLGKRTPQFVGSLVQLITGNGDMMKAFQQNPMSIIKSALTAASYDLPIEPSLGFAYIVPFDNYDKETQTSSKTATFIIGYKGLTQLALRTGAYSRIPDAVDVREGELVSYDRLTGDCVFDWIEDEAEREAKPVIGYAGYFRLKNGAEKTIYMSRAAIDAHERKNRKGKYMGKGWRDDWDSMARKTVIRRLISKYGLMSIDYQQGSEETVRAAETVMKAATEDEFPADVVIEAEDAKEEQYDRA